MKRLPQRKHQSLVRDPWSCSGLRCALECGLEAQRLLPYCCQECSEVHRRTSKLHWLGHSFSTYSLSLAMGLTTIIRASPSAWSVAQVLVGLSAFRRRPIFLRNKDSGLRRISVDEGQWWSK